MAGRFDVFLSYNSSDRPLVEDIANVLRQQGLEPWLDSWALIPGARWQDAIVEGLRTSRACAVMVGEAGLGDWAREELAVAQDRAAKDRGFRIFMVLLPGAPELSDPSLAFLRMRTWVDLRSGVDREGVEDLVSAITGAPRRSEVPVVSTDICPYRGLEAFEEQHADFFFGREDDVSVVVEKLRASRFLAIVGPSGSGKTSLLRAGILPALRAGVLPGSSTWSYRTFTPGSRPLGALAVQLTRLFVDAPVQQTLDRLGEDERTLDLATSVALGDEPARERLVLVVDQFEELFTLCKDEAERSAFLANLIYAATIPGGRVVVVAGMRADFYSRCAAYPELRVLVADQQFLVGPLDTEGVRRAIDEPARRVGLELEAGLTETIAADVAARPGSLPLLEHVLLEVWRRRRGTMLTLEAYVASGKVEGALAQRANAVYASLSAAEREIARRVLLRLVEPGEGGDDTRRRAAIPELVSRPEEKQHVEVVVQVLADHRLLTTARDEVSGAAVVDITHEALIRGWPELRAWINEDREALRAQRHVTNAATEWDRRGRRDEDLYAGSRLAYWTERGTSALSELEQAFVGAGVDREVRERAAGRRRARLAVGGAGLALATVAIVALVGLRSVAAQRDIARSRQLAAEAMALLPTDPADAVGLAADAYELTPTREAEHALKQALSTPGARSASLLGHDGPVQDVAFSPDGSRIVSAGDDGTVRIWEWARGRELTVLRAHESGVNSAAFSPDGSRVVSAGDDGTVRIWEWANGEAPIVLPAHVRWAWGATFSPDGTLVVSAGADGAVRVWDWALGSQRSVLVGPEGSVMSAVFSPDGTRVAVANADGTVRLWEWGGNVEPEVLRVHEKRVAAVTFSPDGTQLVTAGADGTLRVWDWARHMEVGALHGHQGAAESVAVRPDGSRALSAGDDGTVRVWALMVIGEPTVLRGHQGQVNAAAFSPDGRWVVSAGGDGTTRLWDWSANGEPSVLRGHSGAVRTAAFSPDGLQVVSAGDDGTVRVWDWVRSKELAVLRMQAGSVNGASFSPEGTRVVAAGTDGTVRIWSWATSGEPRLLRTPHGGVASAAFSPDGKGIVTAGEDGTVRVWDSAAGVEVRVLRGHQGVVDVAAFSPDGRRVASAGEDATVRVWDWAVGKELRSLLGKEYVTNVAFSPDGARLVRSGDDEPVRVWDWTGSGDATQLSGHNGTVHAAAFSPDGARVVSAGDDRTVRVWDWAAGTEVASLAGHLDWVSSAAFSPDGARVVSGSGDGTVRVTDCTPCYQPERLIVLARSPLVSHQPPGES